MFVLEVKGLLRKWEPIRRVGTMRSAVLIYERLTQKGIATRIIFKDASSSIIHIPLLQSK